jgi:hypothetical protein
MQIRRVSMALRKSGEVEDTYLRDGSWCPFWAGHSLHLRVRENPPAIGDAERHPVSAVPVAPCGRSVRFAAYFGPRTRLTPAIWQSGLQVSGVAARKSGNVHPTRAGTGVMSQARPPLGGVPALGALRPPSRGLPIRRWPDALATRAGLSWVTDGGSSSGRRSGARDRHRLTWSFASRRRTFRLGPDAPRGSAMTNL